MPKENKEENEKLLEKIDKLESYIKDLENAIVAKDKSIYILQVTIVNLMQKNKAH